MRTASKLVHLSKRRSGPVVRKGETLIFSPEKKGAIPPAAEKKVSRRGIHRYAWEKKSCLTRGRKEHHYIASMTEGEKKRFRLIRGSEMKGVPLAARKNRLAVPKGKASASKTSISRKNASALDR